MSDSRRASASDSTASRKSSRKPSPLSRGATPSSPRPRILHSTVARSTGGLPSSRGSEADDDELIPWSQVSSSRGSSPVNNDGNHSRGNSFGKLPKSRRASAEPRDMLLQRRLSQSGTAVPKSPVSPESHSVEHSGDMLSNSNELAVSVGIRSREISSDGSEVSTERGRNSAGNLMNSGSSIASSESAVSPPANHRLSAANSTFESLGAALDEKGEILENLSASAGAFRPTNTRTRKSSKDALRPIPTTKSKLSRGSSPLGHHDTTNTAPPSAGGRSRSSSLAEGDVEPGSPGPPASLSASSGSSARTKRGSSFSGGGPSVFSTGVANLIVSSTANKSRKSTAKRHQESDHVPIEGTSPKIKKVVLPVEEPIVIPEPVVVPEEVFDETAEELVPASTKIYKEYKFKRPKTPSKDPTPSNLTKFYDESIRDILNPGMPEPSIKVIEEDTSTKVNIPIVIPTNDMSYAAARSVAHAVSGTRDVEMIQSQDPISSVFISDGTKCIS